jgi:hypothetical protein
VRDLREKLSGIMHPQPSNADPKPKPKPVSEVVNISRRQTADEMPARQSKRAPKQTSLKKTSQPKVRILLGIVQCIVSITSFIF